MSGMEQFPWIRPNWTIIIDPRHAALVTGRLPDRAHIPRGVIAATRLRRRRKRHPPVRDRTRNTPGHRRNEWICKRQEFVCDRETQVSWPPVKKTTPEKLPVSA